MKRYQNKVICRDCNGACCKRVPGVAYPEDFNMDISPDKLIVAIKSGKWAIDWWEGGLTEDGEQVAYFVRPAIKGKENKIYDPAWYGECVFLNDDGCKLEHNDRPKQCRFLEPKSDGCIMHGGIGKHNAALKWRKYIEILESFRG